MRRPFNYSEKDAIVLSRYFIGEDKGQGYRIQWEDTQSVNDMIQQIVPNKEDTQFNFKSIINKNSLIKFLNFEMKQIKIDDKKYNVDDYIIYIKNNTKWNSEHISFIKLINSLYIGDSGNIDQGFLSLYLMEECEMMDQSNKLQMTNFQIYKSTPKIQIKYDDDEEIVQKPIEIKMPITIEPILTFSQLRLNDNSLKTSESRKPTTCGRENVTYSETYVESIPFIKKQSEQTKVVNLKVEQIKEQQKEEEQSEFKISDSILQPPSLLKNKDLNGEEEQIVEEEIYYEEL